MESLISGLSGKLLGELSSPFLKDVGKYWQFGAKNEFEKLKSTLSAIDAVLLDAEEKQRTNCQLQDWLQKMKLVFYDVEDLLREFSYEVLKRQVMAKKKKAKKVLLFFTLSNQYAYRLKMGRKVKLIREELDVIASESSRFNLNEREKEMHVIRSKRREETHSFVPAEKFIGRYEDKEYVSKLLLQSDVKNNVSIISIVGIGGLGKTTLAQSIYNSEEVKEGFQLMMWVCVSNAFDVKLICRNIIESATKNKCGRGVQMDGVKEKLKKAIDGKRYLLVLDDVWNESPLEWMKLEELLIGGARGSKILITARAQLVAQAAKSVATHSLKGLSSKESWSLFKQVAFDQGVEPESSTIVEIGKEVVEKCVGVPLALKTVGSMLSLKVRESEWLDFKKNDLLRITQDSEGEIVQILKLSYDYLSAPLKRCFAYCAVFPKDYVIERKILIGMWIGQGLIQLDGTSRSLEDVGEQQFMELFNRSFFVGDKVASGSNIWEVKMHDLIHDLAQSIGGNEYCILGSDVNYVDETTLHAWVPQQSMSSLLHAKKLRTLVVAADHEWDGKDFTCDEIKSTSKHMSVLYMKNTQIQRLPDFVNGLRHLSYLNLFGSTFDLLPESICSLYNLQTLILGNCYNLKELPRETRNLVSLRHLDISYCLELRYMPRGLGELTCLQTLTHFVVGPEGKKCGGIGELRSLASLRGFLKIQNLSEFKVVEFRRGNQSFYPGPLTQMESIKGLRLDWYNAYGSKNEGQGAEAELLLLESLKPHPNLEELIVRYYGGDRFPSWMDSANIGLSLPNIVTVHISYAHHCKHLPPLGLLPSLHELRVSFMDGIEYIYEEEEEEEQSSNTDNCARGGAGGCSSSSESRRQLFPSLKVLWLAYLPKLTSKVGPKATSRPSTGHFPVLEKLVIRDCSLLGSSVEILPAWVQYLPNLKSLTLGSCDNIVTLPQWMGNLTSLETFFLENCQSLASIPDCMRDLTSMTRLRAYGCPKIVTRCEKETGEDWPNIAHIPNVWVSPGPIYL